MPSSSKTGLKGCSLLSLDSSLSAFAARISSLKTSSCACLINRIPAETTSSVCREPSHLRATGKRQFSMKWSTRAETLVSLLQLGYLFGSNQYSLPEERNALSTVFSLIWCNFWISTSNTLGFDFVLWPLGRILLQEGWTTPPFVFFSKTGDTKPSCK